MSVATLYQDFKGAVESSLDIDILGSEVGSKLDASLEDVPKIKSVLGEGWKVTDASIPGKEVEQEERQRTLAIYVPPRTTQSYKRTASNGIKVYTHTEPSTTRYQTQTYYVRVLRWFNLDGKIGQNIRFFAHFWDDSGTLKFYVIFAFKNGAIEGGFFAHAYWPERSSHDFSRPRVLVFSHPTKATFGRDWPAGTFLLMELEFGPKLKAAASDTETPLKFGGPLGFANDQFTFDLTSWPRRTLTFQNGKLVIERVRLFAKTGDWSDGEEPRAIEGDDEDEDDSDDDSPDPHDVQFTLLGNLKLTETAKPPIWATLAPDTGVTVWRPAKTGSVLSKASVFNSILGDQAWLGTFGGDLKGYRLRELELVVNHPRRELIYGFYVLEGNLTLKNAGPSPIKLPKARISCTVNFPGRDERQEIVEIECEATLYGTLFEIHADLVEGTVTVTSADGQGFDKWSQSPWYTKRLSSGDFESSDIDGTYDRLHVYVNLKKKTFTASVSNDDGATQGI